MSDAVGRELNLRAGNGDELVSATNLTTLAAGASNGLTINVDNEIGENCESDGPASGRIRIVQSSDVVVGTVTHFNGPVTIVQDNPDTKTEKHSKSEKKPEFIKHKRVLLLIVGLIVISALIVVIYYTTRKEEQDWIGTVNGTIRNVTKLKQHEMLDRVAWGGRPQLNNTRVLKHPTEFVLISHTASAFCETRSSCAVILQTLQSYHVATYKSPDIGHNFLIGGDGNIYIGRGWDQINFHTDGCIGISFIGNYIYDVLTDGMIEAAQLLLDDGVRLGKLSIEYKVVSHNQTYATDSPGENVYKVISRWKHFLTGNSIVW